MRFLQKVTNTLRDFNDLEGFRAWDFPPGTEFAARRQWWGERKVRNRPHEGIDLWQWRNENGGIMTLRPAARVGCAMAGEIVNISPDFMGWTVFVLCREKRLLQIYAHLQPETKLRPGQDITAAAMIGRTTPAGGRSVPPHLHLSLARVSGSLQPARGRLDWSNLGQWPIKLIAPG